MRLLTKTETNQNIQSNRNNKEGTTGGSPGCVIYLYLLDVWFTCMCDRRVHIWSHEDRGQIPEDRGQPPLHRGLLEKGGERESERERDLSQIIVIYSILIEVFISMCIIQRPLKFHSTCDITNCAPMYWSTSTFLPDVQKLWHSYLVSLKVPWPATRWPVRTPRWTRHLWCHKGQIFKTACNG